ncbi:MAG TPA: TonB-dependent receptor [Gemmatimonadales bacterium]|nr:TonB-dependent receptor [Gemmatimonadales bacterium]
MLWGLLFGVLGATSATAGSLGGTVTDGSGNPIPGARVVVVEARRSAITDSAGRYLFINLPGGRYAVSFAAIGFRPVVRTVVVAGDRHVTLDVEMAGALVELSEIQVTASPQATTTLSSPQPISVVGVEALAEVPRLNLASALENLPGLRNLSTGAGIGKPVIRGLTSSRVLVLSDGQRVESQSWGDEHAPNLDPEDAERVEVIRGPASVLYGSEALGGVVNVVSRPLPEAIGRDPFMNAVVGLSYSSSGRQPEGTLRVEGARAGLGLRGSLTGRRLERTNTPDGPLFNSGSESLGGQLAVGLRGSRGSGHVSYARRRERIEIYEDPDEAPGATPYQQVTDDRLQFEATIPLGASHLDFGAAAQRNDRREFEQAGIAEPALVLTSTSVSGDVRFHHAPLGRVGGIVGLAASRSRLTIGGEEALVPANTATQVGVFLYESAELGRFSLSGGVRLDWRGLDVESNAALGASAQRRDYSSVTGNAGAVYRLSPLLALVANIGRGYRAPTAFDLFANGVHEGTARFERGDSTLGNETSLNTDIALRLQAATISAEIGAFVNSIDGFIYPNPTGATDSASGFRIFDITQGDARLTGFEAAAEWHPVGPLHLRTSVDYVRGTNRTLDQPLAFIPPLRLTWGARLELGGGGGGAMRELWLSVSGETNARQERADPEDFSPPGYTLLNIGMGTTIEMGARSLVLSAQVRNALNRRYISFMNRYKFYAADSFYALDPGRDLVLSARLSL